MINDFSAINPYQYREIRTPYCEEMYVDLREELDLCGNEKILDIGAGTGQSSDFFVQQKYDVTLLEPNYNFAKYLGQIYKRYNNVNIVNCKYEDAPFMPFDFDLVIAGTSYHWLDKNQKYKLVYKHLKNEGVLVLFWSRPDFFNTDNGKQVMTIIQKYTHNENAQLESFTSEIRKQLREIRDSNLFKCTFSKIYKYSENYDCKAVSSLLNTLIGVSNLKPEEKNDLFMEIKQYMSDKNLCLSYYIDLYICKKKKV